MRVGDKYEVWFEDEDESQVYTSTIKAITYSSADDKICNCRNCRTIWGKEGGIPAAAVKIEYGDKSHEVFSFQEFQDRLTDNGRPDGIYPHTLRQISRGKEIVSRPAKRQKKKAFAFDDDSDDDSDSDFEDNSSHTKNSRKKVSQQSEEEWSYESDDDEDEDSSDSDDERVIG